MAGDEPRRSGRATKGQHKVEPEPTLKPKKNNKSKVSKKQDEAEEEGEGDVIRCICGHNEDDVEGEHFVACDDCEVWQHNVCMGWPVDLPEDSETHYFCEQCHPEEHKQTLAAMKKGEPIWKERQKVHKKAVAEQEKAIAEQEKALKSKQKGGKKGQKGGRQSRVSDIKPDGAEGTASSSPAPSASRESGTKRKFEEETPQASFETPVAPKESRQASAPRNDKRRKSSAKDTIDPQTALVEIENLPKDRQNCARAFLATIVQSVKDKSKAGQFRVPDGETPESLGRHHASRIEYELHMNYTESDGSRTIQYGNQFRQVLANLKKNEALVDRILKGSLNASELATMSSADMASAELQKERAQLKEEVDKQAVMLRDEDDKPRMRRTHKGDEYVDDGGQQTTMDSVFTSQPVRHRPEENDTEMGDATAGSPDRKDGPAPIDTFDRRASSQFDINNVWAKTQQSPDGEHTTGRPLPIHRQSTASRPEGGRTEDADVDRLLADDNDDSYSPNDLNTSDSSVVWRGKLTQQSVADLTATGRFIAGNDFGRYIPWQEFLPHTFEIEGRLDKAKADDYLCGLQWSKKSDVSVIALTPYDNREAFDAIFDYFATRNRYAVAKKANGISEIVKDLYISPVHPGGPSPPHVELLDYIGIQLPPTERMLFVTFVVNKPASWDAAIGADMPAEQSSLPPNVRASLSGPAASPITTQPPAFSPRHGYTPSQSNGAEFGHQGGGQTFGPGGLPPNPYSAQQQQPQPSARIQQALGPYAYTPVVTEISKAAGGNLDDVMLRNMRDILEREPMARDNMAVFASLLPGANS